MTNLSPSNAVSASTELVSSIAAAAASPAATPEQRAAAVAYLATLVNPGVPVSPAAPTSLAAPSHAVPTPVAPAPPGATPAPVSPSPLEDPASEVASTWFAGELYKEVPTAPLLPGHDHGGGWYGVIRGRAVGLTLNNALAVNAVLGVSNHSMKSFKTLTQALDVFNHALRIGLVEIRDLSDTARVYSDAEFAALIAALHLSHPPSPPPRTPSPAEIFPRESPPPTPANLPPRTPSPRQPLYYYESPTKSGYTDSWATAGAATQGVPGAYVEAVVSRPKKKKSKKKAAYVVFVGRRCGVFRKWSDVAPYVNGVPNAIHCGYRTVSQAEAAYAYACSKSWTRVSGSVDIPRAQDALGALPTPASLDSNNPLQNDEVSDDTWYVVYRGITPGVYRSLLEALLNTYGIPNALHESVDGRTEAFARFDAARRGLRTETAGPPSYQSAPTL
ncbi:hypothetical protein B0H11DRAFT_2256162 [Mycena galericulata]|nr:hypothetical protein B0H11DRAFT_2256162 [Mycena galericulata]